MALGAAIGAVTFTGSIIAFLKLDGRMSGAPIMLPFRHYINIALGLALLFFTLRILCHAKPHRFLADRCHQLRAGLPADHSRSAGRTCRWSISMLNSYSGWAAAGIGFTLANTALIITGALVGSSGAILSYIMCKGMNRSFISVILGGFGGETAGRCGWRQGNAAGEAGLGR